MTGAAGRSGEAAKGYGSREKFFAAVIRAAAVS